MTCPVGMAVVTVKGACEGVGENRGLRLKARMNIQNGQCDGRWSGIEGNVGREPCVRRPLERYSRDLFGAVFNQEDLIRYGQRILIDQTMGPGSGSRMDQCRLPSRVARSRDVIEGAGSSVSGG